MAGLRMPYAIALASMFAIYYGMSTTSVSAALLFSSASGEHQLIYVHDDALDVSRVVEWRRSYGGGRNIHWKNCEKGWCRWPAERSGPYVTAVRSDLRSTSGAFCFLVFFFATLGGCSDSFPHFRVSGLLPHRSRGHSRDHRTGAFSQLSACVEDDFCAAVVILNRALDFDLLPSSCCRSPILFEVAGEDDHPKRAGLSLFAKADKGRAFAAVLNMLRQFR